MKTRIQIALASALVAGTCLFATRQASANELLDRMLNLGGSGCGCSAKGATQKHAVAQRGHLGGAHKGATQNGRKGCGCGATQKAHGSHGCAQKSGAAQRDCGHKNGAAQHGCGHKNGAAQNGGKGCGARQKNCGCGKGATQKNGAAQHGGKHAGGKGCGNGLLDDLKGLGCAAQHKMSQSYNSLQCHMKAQWARLDFGRRCCCGKGAKGKGYDGKYDASPAYDNAPSDAVSPPPAPVVDTSA